MKIDDIDAFVAVMRCQSISLAAQELGLTQPAITRRVQSFEEALGVQLLDRNSKPPKPTDLGKRVHEQCNAVLREIDILCELAAVDFPPAGNIRLGLTQGIGELVALPVLAELKKNWPDVHPLMATGSGGQLMLERLERGELDAAVLFLPTGAALPKNFHGEKLLKSKLIVVGRKDEWNKRQYSLEQCNSKGWVLNPDGCGFRAGLKRTLAMKNLSLLVNLDTYSRAVQLQSIVQGMGLGLFPETLLHGNDWSDQLHRVNVINFKPVIELWLVYGKALGRLQDPAREFGKYIAHFMLKLNSSQRGAPGHD